MSMPSPTPCDNPIRRLGAPWGRAVFFLALIFGPLLMFSCITDKAKEETELTFALDTAKFGKFDSLRLDIYSGTDSTHPVQTQVVKTPKGTKQVKVNLSDAVPADFRVVVTAYDTSGVAYHKEYSYKGGEPSSLPPSVLVSAIKGSSLNLGVGETSRPALTVEPSDADDISILLASEDSTVAKVMGAQKDSLKGLRVGKTHAVASTRDGNVKLRFAVEVVAIRIPVSKLQVSDLSLKVGDSVRPAVTVLPDSATNKDYSLSLLDTGVVKVIGKSVKALRLGKARVIAAAVDFGATDTFTVTVRVPVAGLVAHDLSGMVGDRLLPDLEWTPDSSTDHGYTLKSRDSSLIGVAGDTLLAKAEGSDSVEVTSHDGGIVQVFKVTIGPRVIHPAALDAKDKRILVGDTLPPTLEWTPDSATDKTYFLLSLDTDKVAISGKRFAAKALGSAQVEVTSEDGGLKDTFTVNVVSPAFTPEILPITSSKCAPCHVAGTTFNWQDSASLVQKGVSAIDRLTRADTAKGKMPLPGATGGALTPRELAILLDWLGRTVVPLKSYTIADTAVNLGDTVAPAFTFDPPGATDRVVTLTAVDTSIAAVTGGTRLITKGPGQTTIIAESDETHDKINFKLTVKAPDFKKNVLPITSFKCAPCHSPGTTFNWEDSAQLLLDGAEAIDRLIRPSNAVGRMPLNPGSPNGDLTKQQLSVLLGWLKAKVVPLKGIAAPDDSLKQGIQKAPDIVWDPANATGRLYTLLSLDTDIVAVRGMQYFGKTLGSTQVQIHTREGGFSKTINVKVIPMPLDSVAVRDTGGRIGDTIVPKVIFYPPTTTNKAFTLGEGVHSGFVLIKGDTLIAIGEGTTFITITPADGGTLKASGFIFKVAPIPPKSIAARDTNGVIDQLVKPTITVLPVNATNRDYNLKVDPADTAIAVVVSGQLKGRQVGSAKVTASADGDSTLKDRFTFTVGPVKLDSITATPATLSKGIAANAMTFITWNPTNATDKVFTMVSQDTSKVGVNGDTAVLPKSLGAADVTITAHDGGHQALWHVTVVRSPFRASPAYTQVFSVQCTACHYTGNVTGRQPWDDSTSVVTFRNLITDRVTRPDSLGGRMPPGGARLDSAALKALADWMY
jgi:uncharacterized protein YjdB